MSSDIIKQMASRILNTVKNQYPTHYTDNNKKEQLVKTILGKIDSYSKQINGNTAGKIVQNIIGEIITENHPDRNLKVNYPQRPTKQTISADYMLNPEEASPKMSSLSKAQFERNNLTNNVRQNFVSQRPQTTQAKTNSSNSGNSGNSSFRDNSIFKILKKFRAN